MSKTIKASEFASAAVGSGLLGTPYSKLDCQAFVEKVLQFAGISHNWRGSNHMWREALSIKGTLSEMATMQGGELIPGTWLFKIKDDGGEKERGYNDSEGNACHVGIYLGPAYPRYIHSTSGGVQYGEDMSRWTHAGECIYIDYETEKKTPYKFDVQAFIDYLVNDYKKQITALVEEYTYGRSE